jgi:Kef-type K+ transport systems, membrane components
VFRSLNLPPVLGYLLVGAAIGPHALDLIPDSEATQHLAEFGVVFLMFSIGLEFSLARLYSMKRTVFGLGMAQVAVTVAINVPVALLAGICPWQAGNRAWAASWAMFVPRHSFVKIAWRSACSSNPSTAARSSACCCSRTWRWCRC